MTATSAETARIESAGAAATHPSVDVGLRHVMVVGGTVAEWAALSDDAWDDRVSELGHLCVSMGTEWLTIRPYETGDDPVVMESSLHDVGTCTVLVDPVADGRQRFADAMQRLDADDEVNEASVAAVLYDPADSEPDLVVVLGSSTQLPPSLVWELAYAELVFIDCPWGDLDAADLAAAATEFSGRRRRFGGLES